jgi:hypothetical protein
VNTAQITVKAARACFLCGAPIQSTQHRALIVVPDITTVNDDPYIVRRYLHKTPCFGLFMKARRAAKEAAV